ncbi:MAG: site-specific DNA-methyltransferase [Treponema sp.]|nr:site-specific DNA-methyltransferase [Treponema sp.]
MARITSDLKELKQRKPKTNIWKYAVRLGGTTSDKIVFKHPATFPEKLAQDHILSWSNEGDLVFDPMCGSGITCKMAFLSNRKYLGVDISEEYIHIAKTRLKEAQMERPPEWFFVSDKKSPVYVEKAQIGSGVIIFTSLRLVNVVSERQRNHVRF